TKVEYSIYNKDTYNFNKASFIIVCINTRVLSSSKKKKAYIQSLENRKWVSIIECISTTRQKLHYIVIFKGKNLQTTWFPLSYIPSWLYTTSENGWTLNVIGTKWLQRIFIPKIAISGSQYCLLILDGHSSHINIDFLWLCKQHHIKLLYLPVYLSHVLQPLDLAPFSVIKSSYQRQIQELASLDNAAPIKKERFIACYYQAREEGFTECIIQAGWQAAGICPFNISQVLNSSQVSQRPTTPT
ncbi:CENP-B protein, partial [Amniculicola lignicola CBS 123094]